MCAELPHVDKPWKDVYNLNMDGYFAFSPDRDPHKNFAREDWLLSFAGQTGAAVLYLWQNDPVVVIGRNQNACAQCNLAYTRAEGIPVIRRRTGGGAVYHDAGNLNFSIILPPALYDIARSTAAVVSALRALGVKAEANGRNDICIGNTKVSGSAYYLGKDAGLHHGTILMRVDRERMEKALAVSAQKTASHGVNSVRSRVTDLCSALPHIGLDDLCRAIRSSFLRTYSIASLQPIQPDEGALAERIAHYRDDEWNYARVHAYARACTARFDWGTVQFSVGMDGTTPTDVAIDSDALDADFIDAVRSVLTACLPLADRADFLQIVQQKLNRPRAEDARILRDLVLLLTNRLSSAACRIIRL